MKFSKAGIAFLSSLLAVTNTVAPAVMAKDAAPFSEQSETNANATETSTFASGIQPVPFGTLSSDAWGAAEVGKRDQNNGLEDKALSANSYWGGNIIKDDASGKYYMFATRWNQADGAAGRAKGQITVATASDPKGPYTDNGLMDASNWQGLGDNIVPFKISKNDPKYAMGYRYAMIISGVTANDVHQDTALNASIRYTKSLSEKKWYGAGTAKFSDPDFDKDDLSVMLRPDGAYAAVNAKGQIAISSGLENTWYVDNAEGWTAVDGVDPEDMADPVMWYEDGMYHMIATNKAGTKGFYLSSANGIDGWRLHKEAAFDTSAPFFKYTDGTVNNWAVASRPGVYMEDGHFKALTLSVDNVALENDLGGDKNGSKIVVMPYDNPSLKEAALSDEETDFVIKNNELTLKPGESAALETEFTSANGEDLVFTSLNEKIATVDASGKVTAKDFGDVEIMVRTADSTNAKYAIVHVADAERPDVVSADTFTWYAPNGSLALLPTFVDAKFSDGTTGKAEVEWFTDGQPITKKTTIKGRIKGTAVQVMVNAEVVSSNLTYFIDCNSTKSNLYDKLNGNSALVNTVPDQKSTDGSWGYLADYAGKAKSDYDSFYGGWEAAEGQNIEYKIPLEDGTWNVTFGFRERSLSVKDRPMMAYGTWAGEEHEIGAVNTIKDGQRGDITYTYTVNVTDGSNAVFGIRKTGAEQAVLSNIQIQKVLNTAALDTAISNAKDAAASKATETQREELSDLLESAHDALLKSDTTQGDIDAIVSDLNDFTESLGGIADVVSTSILEFVLNAATSINKQLFTRTDWASYDKTVEDAIKVKDKPTDQNQVDGAASDLAGEYIDLRYKPDEQRLEDLYNAMNKN